jgi:putative transposase
MQDSGWHAHARPWAYHTAETESGHFHIKLAMQLNESQYRKKCRRYNDSGHAHALTFCCFQRRPFLSKDRSRQWVIDAIAKAREKHRLHLWGYVVMPEHVHILLWPESPIYSISQILTTIKQSVSKRSLLFVRQYAPGFLKQMEDRQPNGTPNYRFWQRGGGYDRNLTEPTTIWAEIDYMHNNPIRRGLCARVTDWIWSSAIEFEHPGKGLLRLDLDSFPRTVCG